MVPGTFQVQRSNELVRGQAQNSGRPKVAGQQVAGWHPKGELQADHRLISPGPPQRGKKLHALNDALRFLQPGASDGSRQWPGRSGVAPGLRGLALEEGFTAR